MDKKIVIEVYKNKTPEELTKLLAGPESRLETGSGLALTASVAAALLCRAAALTVPSGEPDEKTEYIARNGEIVRGYMVHLIDEDVKCRGPLKRALKEGKEQEIQAAMRPAVAICEEIVNMMGKCLDLLLELAPLCPEDARHYVRSSAELAMGTVRAAIPYILNMTAKSTDDTYRYVTGRENEMTLSQYEGVCEKIRSACSAQAE